MEAWRKELYLAHHGVKGQRWGVRRGPPYPLGSDKSTSRQPKRQIKGPLDKIVKAGKMAVYKLLQTHGKDPVPAFKVKSKPVENTLESIKADLAAINPSGNKTNCTACAVAYDMRRRGFDVTANTKGDEGYLEADVCQWYKNPEFVTLDEARDQEDAYDKLTERLKEYGEGSRGMVSGIWDAPPYIYGHSIAWQVVESGVLFLDGQANKVYDDPYGDIFSGFVKDEIRYARLDNLEFRPKKIKEAVKNVE